MTPEGMNERRRRSHEADEHIKKSKPPEPPPVPKMRHELNEYQKHSEYHEKADQDYKLNEFGDIDYRQTTNVFASVGNHKKLGSDGQIPGLGYTRDDDEFHREFDFMIGKDRNKGLPKGSIPGLKGSSPPPPARSQNEESVRSRHHMEESVTGHKESSPAERCEEESMALQGQRREESIPGLDSPESDYRLPALPEVQKKALVRQDPWEELSHTHSRRSPKRELRSSPRRRSRSPKGEYQYKERSREETREAYNKSHDDPYSARSPKRSDHRRQREEISESYRVEKEDPYEKSTVKNMTSIEIPGWLLMVAHMLMGGKQPKEARTIRMGTIHGAGLQIRKSKSKSPQKQPEVLPNIKEVKLPPKHEHAASCCSVKVT